MQLLTEFYNKYYLFIDEFDFYNRFSMTFWCRDGLEEFRKDWAKWNNSEAKGSISLFPYLWTDRLTRKDLLLSPLPFHRMIPPECFFFFFWTLEKISTLQKLYKGSHPFARIEVRHFALMSQTQKQNVVYYFHYYFFFFTIIWIEFILFLYCLLLPKSVIEYLKN